jgi:integrase
MPAAADTSPTFAQAWDTWLAYRSCGARPLRLSTLADYRSIYRCHLGPLLGETPLSEIDGSAIACLVVELGATGTHGKRLANVLVPLRACLRWHHRMGSFERDPSAWFEPPPAAADERRVLTIEQVERLIAALPPQHRILVACAAYTGMRAGELRALTWADVDLDAHTVRVDKTLYRTQVQRSTKTGHDRTVPVPPHLASLLRELRRERAPSPADLVFCSATGGPLDLDDFRARVFKPAVCAAGLASDLRFHDLRHTSASLYLQSGATLREVMEIHGWRQLQTAQRYLHTLGPLSEAAERLGRTRESALSGQVANCVAPRGNADAPATGNEAKVGTSFA